MKWEKMLLELKNNRKRKDSAVFGSALLCFNLNKSYWGDNAIVKSIFDMPIDLVGYISFFKNVL